MTALAVIATAIWTAFLRTSREDRARRLVGVIVRRIEHGDVGEKVETIRTLRMELTKPAEFAQVFPSLIRAMKDESEGVRLAAALTVGEINLLPGQTPPASDSPRLIPVAACLEAEKALAALLDEPSPMLRAAAAKSLGFVARVGPLDAQPPRLVACLNDEAEEVRVGAAGALLEYRKGPELIVPVAVRRLPTESPAAHQALTDVFWQVRLEPSVLPVLVEGLSSENTDVCLSCTAAINHMGRDAGPALPAILSLLRKELESPHAPAEKSDQIIGMASGAVGELSADAEDPPNGTVELLCEVLTRSVGTREAPDPARSVSPVASSKQALDSHTELKLKEAIWSLGILGRSAATAVPLLLSTFEAVPEVRGLLAESLVEITRGTPDEERVIASLASAWGTASREQRAVFARALRSLGPKSVRAVPELKQLPPDPTRSQIRRVRFPRSRRELPVRE